MNESPFEDSVGETPISYLLIRSTEILKSLPVEYQWEFTRRHPYYLQFWRSARELQEHPSADSTIRIAQEAAAQILSAVNVAPTALPPDPRDGFETLGMNTIGAGWEGGAVAPAMFRTMAHMLLVALPKIERAQLGRLLNESAEFDSNNTAAMLSIHQRLGALTGEVWHSFPEVPIMSVNLQASQRAITEAVETLVRRWKQERGISETRRRDDKLEEYLEIWDLREGWGDGAYDGTKEKRLREIAEEMHLPLTTVVNRYRAAFKYLSGHDYRPELWIQLFGPIKLVRSNYGTAESRLALRRPWRTRNLRPVSEGVLLPGRSDADNLQWLEGAGITLSDIGYVDLQLDIQTLIERGDSDAQILEELDPGRELPDGLLSELINILRARGSDSL